MSIYEEVTRLEQENRPFVLATVVEQKGSVPGKVGFKMLVREDGSISGTVGGGAIEKEVIREALQRLRENRSGLQEYLLSKNKTEAPGDARVVPMMCNGKVWVYYEVHGSLPTVYVFGGGHVGQALLYFLKPLGYHRVLIDNREEFANPEKNPHASEWIFSDYEKYARGFQPAPGSFAVILTHGHVHDHAIARAIFERRLDLAYVGVIASRNKAASLRKYLQEELGKEVDLSRLHSPVGLNIGGTTATEIALSIAAEIQAVRYGLTETT